MLSEILIALSANATDSQAAVKSPERFWDDVFSWKSLLLGATTINAGRHRNRSRHPLDKCLRHPTPIGFLNLLNSECGMTVDIIQADDVQYRLRLFLLDS